MGATPTVMGSKEGSARTLPTEQSVHESKDDPIEPDVSHDGPLGGSMEDNGSKADSNVLSGSAAELDSAWSDLKRLTGIDQGWTHQSATLTIFFTLALLICLHKALWHKVSSESMTCSGNLGIENMIMKGMIVSSMCIASKEELRTSGSQILVRRVDKRNRALWKHRAKCMFVVLLTLSLTSWMAVQLNRAMRHDPPELPSSEDFVEAGKKANTFEAWSQKVFHMTSEGESLRLEITHVMRGLGPVYTNDLRHCLKRKRSRECRELEREAYVVSTKGFEKGVFFLVAPMTANIRSGTMHEVIASSTVKLLRSLKIDPTFKGKKNIASFRTGGETDSKVTFGEDTGMVLLPLALEVVPKMGLSDTMLLSGFFVVLGMGLLFLIYVASHYDARTGKFDGHHASRFLSRMYNRLAQFIIGHWSVTSTSEQLLADIADRYLGKLAAAEVRNAVELKHQILEDIGMSAEYGILVEKGNALLSQSWLVVGDRHGLNVAYIGIRTSLSLDSDNYGVHDNLIGDEDSSISGWRIHHDVHSSLHSRLKNGLWQEFQILRQLDCRLFLRCQDAVHEFDAMTMSPTAVLVNDSVLELLPEDGTSPPCSITQNGEPCKHGLFLLPSEGKHIFSWDGFVHAIKERSKGLSEGHDIIFGGCADTDIIRIRDDPFRAPLSKSRDVDFGARHQMDAMPKELENALLQFRQLLSHAAIQVPSF